MDGGSDLFFIIGCNDRKKLKNNLLDKEFWTPTEQVVSRSRRKRGAPPKVNERPLLYEYCFVKLWDSWFHVFDWPEVMFVLMSDDGRPALVNRAMLAEVSAPVLAAEAPGNWDGLTVEFANGVFAGMRGKFLKNKVEIEMFGGKISVAAPKNGLRLVNGG